MSRPSSLGFFRYEAESTFGENTATFATRLPVLDSIDVSGLEQSMIDPARVQQHLLGGSKKIPGPMGGAFKLKLHLTGHGSATSGATALTSLGTFLGVAVGNAAVAASTGTTATGGTAAVPTVAAATGFSAGALARIGVKGDGRGEGYFVPVSSHSGSNLNLLLAAPAAPNNADVVHSAEMVYPQELVGASDDAAVNSFRALLGTGNLVYECHGCWVNAYTIGGLANGEIPFIELDCSVAWFALNSAITFPVSTSVETFTPVPTAGGNFVMGAVGATTRTNLAIRNFEMSVALGSAPIMAPGGVNDYQTIVGATRTTGTVNVTLTLDAETDPADNEFLNWLTNASKQLCYTLNTQPGAAIGLYFPNLVRSGKRPVQMSENDINRQKLEFQAITATTGSTDLALSAFRIALA